MSISLSRSGESSPNVNSDCEIVATQFAEYSKTDLCKAKESIQPRCIFISLSTLWKEWRNIPFDILHSSLMAFNCERKYVFGDHRSKNVFKDKLLHRCASFGSDSELTQFLTKAVSLKHFRGFQSLLVQKEKQGRLLWIGQNVKDKNDDWCDPKWRILSDWLTTNRDPITHRYYNPIITNQQWWEQRIDIYNKEYCDIDDKADGWGDTFTQLQYCNEYSHICSELQDLTFRYRPVLEILRQSNLTIIPCRNYEAESYQIQTLSDVQLSKSLRKNPNLSQITFCRDWKKKYNSKLKVKKELIKNAAIAALHLTVEIIDDDGMVWLDY